MPKHKHAELIKAWADGAEIEWRRFSNTEWLHLSSPNWLENDFYRIKPAKKSAGQVLKESYPLSVPYMHWDNLDNSTKDYYERHAQAFLEAWKKENE